MDEPRFTRIFFDLTGTLLRVRGSVGAVYAEAARPYGVQVAAPDVDAAFRAALAAAPPACFPDVVPAAIPAAERAWWRDVVARTFAPLARFDDFDAFFGAVFEAFRGAEHWEVLPGARHALGALRSEGRRLGIVSEMDGRVHDVLRALELDGCFDPVLLSTECGEVKENGGLFRVALERTGDPAWRCLHVGDSLRADVQGARAAGVEAILIDPTRGPAPHEVCRVHGLDALPHAVRRLEAEAPFPKPPGGC